MIQMVAMASEFLQTDIAIIPIYGNLERRSCIWDELTGTTSYEALEDTFTTALHDDEIASIVLDVDSCGGDVAGLFDLVDMIYNGRSVKPIWAVVNESAYSAAYALASAAEKVFLTRTAGVGSIGVIASHINQAGFDEKLGLEYTTLFAGERKNDLSPHHPLSKTAQATLQTEIDRLYELLVATVARNRKLSPDQIRQTQAGLCFGADAVHAGLADGVLTLSAVLTQLSPERKNIMTNNIKNTEREDYRNQVLALAKACELAGRPEQLIGFIEQDISLDQAKDTLMALLAQHPQQTVIQSHVSPVAVKPPVNPVIVAAQARGRSA